MAKLKREQFRQLFPTASITDWVKYRYVNGKVNCTNIQMSDVKVTEVE